MLLYLPLLIHIQYSFIQGLADLLHGRIALHLDTFVGSRLHQQAMQIRTVQGDIRRAIPCRSFFQRQSRHHLARGKAARLQTSRKRSHLLECIPQAPSLQNARHIGAKLHTRPDF